MTGLALTVMEKAVQRYYESALRPEEKRHDPTFCPLCREYLGGTRAPVGWPRCKSSGELRQERQYRD